MRKNYKVKTNYSNNQAFSDVDLVNQCLVDEKRTRALETVIKKLVKSNHTVLDLGTGSGILAMFAARAGAKKIIAIEFDEFIAEIARENIKNNGFKNKIEVIISDARNLSFPKNQHFDVVIGEMLTTGMVDEFQVQAIKNLHRQSVVSNSTIFIPKCQETYIALGWANFQIYGFQMKMVRHLWEDSLNNQKVFIFSKPSLLSRIDFSEQTDEIFENVISLKTLRDGKVNSIYLSSRTILSKEHFLEDTKALNAPVVIPIAEKKVSAGENIKIKIKYGFGRGYGNFHAEMLQT